MINAIPMTFDVFLSLFGHSVEMLSPHQRLLYDV